jgi:hypothetical protein
MKKIALLFTMVCASQLYGMEPEYGLQNLPPDMRREIVNKAIESSATLESAVKAVNTACVVHGACYNNLKDFTKLVHMLADKFGNATSTVANKFGTEIAKEYIKKGRDLRDTDWEAPSFIVISIVKKKIEDGADVNFSEGGQLNTLNTVRLKKGLTIRGTPSSSNYEKIEKELINAGAKE